MRSKKSLPITSHEINCKFCKCTFKSFCKINKGSCSQLRIDCPKCGNFTGWLRSSPGFKVERIMYLIRDEAEAI